VTREGPDEDAMRRAIELARAHMEQGDGGPFGAVIVQGGLVVAEGWNQVTSTNDPTAHAEVTAIRRACAALGTFSLAGCDLYTSCEPCPMCLAAAYWAGVARIFYAADRHDAARAGFSDAVFYEQLALPPEGRAVPQVQLLGDEGRAPFAAWLEKADRVPY
jgi:tRNA(Arg) A34 adenosine deaminase TadA